MEKYANGFHDHNECDENLTIDNKEKQEDDYDDDHESETNLSAVDEEETKNVSYEVNNFEIESPSTHKNNNNRQENINNNENIVGILIGLIAALFFGLLGAAIIDSILGYRCPYCNYRIEKDATYCKNCHKTLRWD